MKQSNKIALLVFSLVLIIIFMCAYGLISVWNHNIAGVWIAFAVYAVTLTSLIYIFYKEGKKINKNN